MAFILNDRVKVTSTTAGTGVFALGSATAGFETFATGIGGSNTTYYAIAHQSAAEFEVGFGTLDADGWNLVLLQCGPQVGFSPSSSPAPPLGQDAPASIAAGGSG